VNIVFTRSFGAGGMNFASLISMGAGLAVSLSVGAGATDISPDADGRGSLPASAAAGSVAPAPMAEDNADQEGRSGAEAIPKLSDAELGRNRGGQSVASGIQNLTGITQGNVINGNYVAGEVTISDNALTNFNGVGNIAINTGAQVSLQSAMNLTINFAP
jgi:hypothetical protein